MMKKENRSLLVTALTMLACLALGVAIAPGKIQVRDCPVQLAYQSTEQDIVVIHGQRYDVNEVIQALTRDEDARRAEAIRQKLEWNTKTWKENQKWKQ